MRNKLNFKKGEKEEFPCHSTINSFPVQCSIPTEIMNEDVPFKIIIRSNFYLTSSCVQLKNSAFNHKHNSYFPLNDLHTSDHQHQIMSKRLRVLVSLSLAVSCKLVTKQMIINFNYLIKKMPVDDDDKKITYVATMSNYSALRITVILKMTVKILHFIKGNCVRLIEMQSMEFIRNVLMNTFLCVISHVSEINVAVW
jgi:hypothetical protein